MELGIGANDNDNNYFIENAYLIASTPIDIFIIDFDDKCLTVTRYVNYLFLLLQYYVLSTGGSID